LTGIVITGYIIVTDIIHVVSREYCISMANYGAPTMTVEMRSGKVCVAMAVAAVPEAQAAAASSERHRKHITIYIVPPGHHSRNLQT
jgi:hypothetical protein